MAYVGIIHFVLAMVAGMTLQAPAAAGTGGEKSLTAPATDADIAALVSDLSDPSYEKRTYATRRLCAIGMPATEKLRAAAAGDDAETALRAKAVLSLLDNLMFSGVEVRLSFSKSKIAWDQPVDLNLTLTNRAKYPARVPFEIDPAKRTAAGDDAQQVGSMLDVADLVHVRGADGREIDLAVDDISADSQVVAAVQRRLNEGPVSTLDPGQQVKITVAAFNRGWARYLLLDTGVYTITMDYTPEWEDDALATQRVGRVVSNPATITISTGAPATVSRSGAEASLAIERDGAFIAARLTNRTDQAMLVNKNFGRLPPFADGHWVYELDGTRQEVPVIAKSAASWHDFKAALLVEVGPGQSVELARIDLNELRRALSDAGAELDGRRWTVHFSYVNLCGRQWQVRQGSALLGNSKAPAIFQVPLPRRILSTGYTSNRLTAPTID
ncbi:MAG: hypothetical protein JSU86_18625 [Phycisphaerales bacterium]|nr:MAG: hypothetical protein JSU86_18625 [Phycisphaerales bacterium]